MGDSKQNQKFNFKTFKQICRNLACQECFVIYIEIIKIKKYYTDANPINEKIIIL